MGLFPPSRVPKAQLLAMAALLLYGVDAALDGMSGYGEPFKGRVGPFDSNSTAFLEVVAASNSTGIYKIPGFDISKPYPGAPIDGWTLRIAAVDLSHPKEQYSYDSFARVEMLGYALSIQSPPSLIKDSVIPNQGKVVNADPSWGMCLWNFAHPVNRTWWNNPDNKPLSPDGSCKGLLSDACIAALERAASDEYRFQVVDSPRNATRLGSLVTCNSLSTPKECGEFGPGNTGSGVPSYSGVPVQFLNGSVTWSDGWLFENDKGEKNGYNSYADLQEFWDSMVVNYWVAVTAMVNATIDPAVDWGQREGGKPQVLCVAPNGMGTGKAFTFNGTVPASAGVGIAKGGGEGEKKNGVDSLRPGVGCLGLGMILSVYISLLS